MAEGFVQRNGSLPYIEGTPNASAFKEPYPYFEFRQDDDLPYIIGTPESYAFESPTPYALYKRSDDKYNGLPYLDFSEAYGFTIPTPFALYMQKDGMYDGLPYLNFPPEFLILSPPFPHEMITDNKAKKKQYTIIVSNYSEKITVPDYKFEVIGKYPSTKRGDLI